MCEKSKSERHIRHAIIAEEKDEECYKLTVWGGLIKNILDGHTYFIKSVLLKGYYGLRLNTTSSTVFEAHSIQYNVQWSKFSIDDGMVRCAAVKSSRLTHFINISMRAVSVKSPHFQVKKKVTSDSCKKKMLVTRLIKHSNIELEFQDKFARCDVIVKFCKVY